MIRLLKNLLTIVSKTKRAAFDYDPEVMAPDKQGRKGSKTPAAASFVSFKKNENKNLNIYELAFIVV